MKPMWKEGLYMMPQHLQMLDAWQEQLVTERVGSVVGFPWGLVDLEFNPEGLPRGIVRLERAVAIMPDGLLVEIGPRAPIKGLVRTIEPSALRPEASATLDLHLAVPDDSSRGTRSYAGSEDVRGSRYAMTTEKVRDAYGVSEEVAVACVRPNVQLLLGDEDRQSYITLKIAELRLSEAGVLSMSDQYIAPCLRVRSSSGLTKRLTQLVGQIAARQGMMADRYRGRIGARIDFGAADVVSLLFLQALSASLPRLSHAATLGLEHPETLYLTLAELVGRLENLALDGRPKELPTYAHDRLSAILFPMMERISSLMDRLSPQRYHRIALETPQRGLFVARDIDPTLLRDRPLFLVAKGEIQGMSLARDLPTYMRVASYGRISDVVSSALPGLRLEVEVAPPTALPVREGHVYLRLHPSGEHWQTIVSSRSIAIYQPIEPDRVEIELLAVEP